MAKDGTQIVEVDETLPLDEGTSEEAKTFTQAELDAQVTKAKSDALAAAGRDFKGLSEAKKAIDNATATAKALLDRAEVRQKELDERELETVRDDPDRLQILRDRQSIRRERMALEKEKADRSAEEAHLTAELNEGRQSRRQSQISEIVQAQRIDQNKLADLIDDNMSIDTITKIASALPKVVTNTPRSDTGGTSGGVAQNALEIKQDYIAGRITQEQRSERLKAIGVNPIP